MASAAAIVLALVVWLVRDGGQNAGVVSSASRPLTAVDSDVMAPLEGQTSEESRRVELEQPSASTAAKEYQASLLVRVIDEDGAAFEGMRLTLVSDGGKASRTTSERGEAVFAGLEAAEYCLCSRGLYRVSTVELSSGEQLEHELVVPRNATRLRVLGENGIGVEGAEVLISRYGASSGDSVGTTDAAGEITLENIAPEWSFEVRAAGYRPAGRFTLGNQVEKTVVLKTGGMRAEGRVVDSITGEGVDAALVIVGFGGIQRSHLVGNTMMPGPTDFRVWTSDGGFFRVEGLHRGRYAVGVQHPRYAVLKSTLDADEPWLSPAVEFRLEPSVVVSGTVVGPDGNPAPGCMVRAMYADGLEVDTLTDGLGRYVFKNLSSGSFTLWAMKAGVGDSPVLEAEAPGKFDLMVETARNISVQVVDDKGLPVSGAGIELWKDHSGGGPVRVFRTGEDGHFFSVERHGAETVVVAIYGQGQRSFPIAVVDVEVGVERTVSLPLPSMCTIRADPGVALYITQEATHFGRIFASIDGAWILVDNVSPGSYVVDRIDNWPNGMERVGVYRLAPGEILELGHLGD